MEAPLAPWQQVVALRDASKYAEAIRVARASLKKGDRPEWENVVCLRDVVFALRQLAKKKEALQVAETTRASEVADARFEAFMEKLGLAESWRKLPPEWGGPQ